MNHEGLNVLLRCLDVSKVQGAEFWLGPSHHRKDLYPALPFPNWGENKKPRFFFHPRNETVESEMSSTTSTTTRVLVPSLQWPHATNPAWTGAKIYVHTAAPAAGTGVIPRDSDQNLSATWDLKKHHFDPQKTHVTFLSYGLHSQHCHLDGFMNSGATRLGSIRWTIRTDQMARPLPVSFGTCPPGCQESRRSYF